MSPGIISFGSTRYTRWYGLFLPELIFKNLRSESAIGSLISVCRSHLEQHWAAATKILEYHQKLQRSVTNQARVPVFSSSIYTCNTKSSIYPSGHRTSTTRVMSAVPAKMPPVQDPTYFDPDGDLQLHIGPEKSACVVCSRSLSRASPVFKRMLYGGFAESKPAHGEWIVALPEDNQEAMFLLLNIVHGHSDAVPMRLPDEKLYHVTVLTDKYNMTKCLHPWAHSWRKHFVKPDTSAKIARRIWIAWELGIIDIFMRGVQALLHSSSTTIIAGCDSQDTGHSDTFTILENLGILGMF